MLEKLIAVIFDCNIIWQAFFAENGAAGRCQQLARDGKITLYLSIEILAEMRDVLTRPETQTRFAKATDEAVEAYLDDLAERALLFVQFRKCFLTHATPTTSHISIWRLKLKPIVSLAATKICLI